MNQHRGGRNTVILSIMLVVGIIYLVLLNYQHPLTHSFKVDGILSVLLGLYICSHPVANILDLILYRRFIHRKNSHPSSEWLWWLLNAVVLFTGWWVIFVGMLRFSAPSG